MTDLMMETTKLLPTFPRNGFACLAFFSTLPPTGVVVETNT